MRRASQLAVLLICLAMVAQSTQLPIRVYTTADGLAHNSVHRIVADSQGFLWFATSEGLSRFDGYQFTTFGTAQGLPHRAVYDLLEATNGVYWLATPEGLCRFDPNSSPAFRTYVPSGPVASRWVNTILEDGDRALWCGTKVGLYHFVIDSGVFERIDFVRPRESGEDQGVRGLLEDRAGSLWVAAGSGLYRHRGQKWDRFTTGDGLPSNDALSVLQDPRGRIWVGVAGGLCQISENDSPAVFRTWRKGDGLPGEYVQSLHAQPDGRLWIGAPGGLAELPFGASRASVYSAQHGLSSSDIEALAEDREGNLWIGTDGGGALRMARDGFVTFTSADGLAPGAVVSIRETRRGELYIATRDHGRLFLSRLEGDRFAARPLAFPPTVTNLGWGWGQIMAEDQTGRLWVATGIGPAVFLPGPTSRPAVFPFRGPHASNVFRLFTDSHQTLWISTSSSDGNGLASFSPGTNTFHQYSEKDALAASPLALWGAFAEDQHGGVWMGSIQTGELARYANGRFTMFTREQGLPPGEIRWLHSDHAGSVWIASGGSGLVRIDDPGSEHPRFTTYGPAQGLSSNFATSIAEDGRGRIYVSTAKGVDRFDRVSGRIRHYTTADGLVHGELQVGFADRLGRVWFGGPQGVSRLSPESNRTPQSPAVLITGVRIAGLPCRISAVGQKEVRGLELQPGQNHLRLDFVSLAFGDALRYQFKLDSVGSEWSEPTEQRSVEYAQLSPGTYRFLVRALTADGTLSGQPASVNFTVIAPVWRRWWFFALAASAAGLLAFTAYRYRVEQLLELERVRTRIATDLHDDIGSSLSQISILSEVTQRRLKGADSEITGPLSDIASISRELVDSMSDIVWAINPARDRFVDLALRMRHFATEQLELRSIHLQFHGPAEERDLPIDSGTRREIFLIFKESIHNIVQHSGCTEVVVDLNISGGLLSLLIRDNGRGIPSDQTHQGHGLSSMCARAEAIGGSLELGCEGPGALLRLLVPLG